MILSLPFPAGGLTDMHGHNSVLIDNEMIIDALKRRMDGFD
jgi:hypothetical protein